VDPLEPDAAQSLRDLLAGGPGPQDGGRVDPLHHWVYFQNWSPLSSLGSDGHPRSGGFLPPLHDRRRMFAGGRCTFHAPLYFGRQATATSALAHCQVKHARSGELLLVTVGTTIVQNGRVCITDEQDLVYRSGPRPQAPDAAAVRAPAPAADTDVARRRCTTFEAVTLFRFSALTANSHRIHYDLPYARDVEGYAGLLVHGPLLVLSMVGTLCGADAADLATLSYRLHQPVFAGEAVDICLSEGTTSRVTIVDPTGGLRASAEARFRRGTAGN
jgi:3-methylfumaryl-CoA hydratase